MRRQRFRNRNSNLTSRPVPRLPGTEHHHSIFTCSRAFYGHSPLPFLLPPPKHRHRNTELSDFILAHAGIRVTSSKDIRDETDIARWWRSNSSVPSTKDTKFTSPSTTSSSESIQLMLYAREEALRVDCSKKLLAITDNGWRQLKSFTHAILRHMWSTRR